MVRRSSQAGWLLVVAGLMIPTLFAVGVYLAMMSVTTPSALAVGSFMFMITSFLVVPTRHGSLRTVAHGTATAIPLITVGGVEVYDVAGAVAVGLFGVGAAWLISVAGRRDQRQLAPTVLASLVTYGVYVMMMSTLEMTIPFDEVVGWERTGLVAVSVLAAFASEMLLTALLAFGRFAGGFRYRLARSLGDADSFLAVTGAGALVGLAFDFIDWWALVVGGLLYSFTHTSLTRLRSTRTTYEQTLRALAQIPEVAGHAREGHALAAHEWARLVALDMGLTPRQLEQTRHAALMHQVGLVALNEPGVVLAGYTDIDVARWGAEVLGEAEYLRPVAQKVRRQFEPYRLPGGPVDTSVDLGTRIVRAVGAYCSQLDRDHSPGEALDFLQRGSADAFDPDVVSSLRRIVERTVGLYHPVSRR